MIGELVDVQEVAGETQFPSNQKKNQNQTTTYNSHLIKDDHNYFLPQFKFSLSYFDHKERGLCILPPEKRAGKMHL